MSVLLVGVGLYLTNSFDRDQLSQQREATREQQDLAVKGQRADRFVAAVDQIGQEGKEKLSLRLGGIYALEALMTESPEAENSVIEVICAFVRTHAPMPEVTPKEIPDSPEDVRTAVAVLGRRPRPEDHTPLDLSNTLLGLRAATLANTNFRGANLASADLDGADLTGADLTGANLSSADLSFAKMNKANLLKAGLDGASLYETGLRGANLASANLHLAVLYGANLAGANLIGTHVDSIQVACSLADASTRLPVGIARPDKAGVNSSYCRGHDPWAPK